MDAALSIDIDVDALKAYVRKRVMEIAPPSARWRRQRAAWLPPVRRDGPDDIFGDIERCDLFVSVQDDRKDRFGGRH
jgi:hypothetical protein